MEGGGRIAVAFEDVLPGFVYRGVIMAILLVEFVFEPAIDAGCRVGLYRHAGRLSDSMIAWAAWVAAVE